MTIIILFLFGSLAGMVGTIVGIGGGVFVSPLLFLVYGFSPQLVIGTSLAVVFCNTLSGTIAYAIKKRIHYGLGWRFALFTIPGAVIGSYLSQVFNPLSFRIVFGIILIILPAYLFINLRRNNHATSSEPINLTLKQCLIVYLLSIGVGALSSFIGIGGGIIHTPILIYLLKVPVHMATATSCFILTFTSLTGVITHFYLGNVALYYALALGIGAVCGAQVGASVSHKVESKKIIILLAIILALTGLRLLIINIS